MPVSARSPSESQLHFQAFHFVAFFVVTLLLASTLRKGIHGLPYDVTAAHHPHLWVGDGGATSWRSPEADTHPLRASVTYDGNLTAFVCLPTWRLTSIVGVSKCYCARYFTSPAVRSSQGRAFVVLNLLLLRVLQMSLFCSL